MLINKGPFTFILRKILDGTQLLFLFLHGKSPIQTQTNGIIGTLSKARNQDYLRD